MFFIVTAISLHIAVLNASISQVSEQISDLWGSPRPILDSVGPSVDLSISRSVGLSVSLAVDILVKS